MPGGTRHAGGSYRENLLGEAGLEDQGMPGLGLRATHRDATGRGQSLFYKTRTQLWGVLGKNHLTEKHPSI